MPRDPHRSRRIEGELQRVVSELLRREVRDPRVGSITITDVRVSPDFKSAKIFYALFDEQRDAAKVQAGLERVAGFLRGPVGRSLKLRVAPELVFRPDEQLAAGMRLNSLIDSAVAEDERRHTEDDPAIAPDPQPASKD
jgi:ribosome-binding factor A